MKEILQHPHEALSTIAKEVERHEFGSGELRRDIQDMQEALSAEPDGVAIAAPQIGISKRIFVVSGRIFQKDENAPTPDDAIFINPEIVKQSKETEWFDEGCLSVRPMYGEIERATKVTVRAKNEAGEVFERGAGGLLAQIFQHEIDHLNGILFIDKARNVTKALPQEEIND